MNNSRTVVFGSNGRVRIYHGHQAKEMASAEGAIVDPDLRHLEGIPPHFWKKNGNSIVPMSNEEKCNFVSGFILPAIRPKAELKTASITGIMPTPSLPANDFDPSPLWNRISEIEGKLKFLVDRHSETVDAVSKFVSEKPPVHFVKAQQFPSVPEEEFDRVKNRVLDLEDGLYQHRLETKTQNTKEVSDTHRTFLIILTLAVIASLVLRFV